MSVNYSSECKTMHFKWSVQTAPPWECLQTSPGSNVMTTSQGTCNANIWPLIRKDKICDCSPLQCYKNYETVVNQLGTRTRRNPGLP